MGDGFLDEIVSLVDKVKRLEQVDDVNAVALHEDVLLHLRVPTAGLMAEMQSSLQHVAHSDLSHGNTTFLVGYCLVMCHRVQLVAKPTDTGRRGHDANYAPAREYDELSAARHWITRIDARAK